jgi:hypothetical protein
MNPLEQALSKKGGKAGDKKVSAKGMDYSHPNLHKMSTQKLKSIGLERSKPLNKSEKKELDNYRSSK